MINFTEWRNNNKHVKYPFSDTSALTNGSIFLDQDLFDDARLYPIGSSPGVYLSDIIISDVLVKFIISDPENGELASGGFAFVDGDYTYPSLPVDDSEVLVALEDTLGRPAGVLVSSGDRLRQLSSLYGQSTISFDETQTEFVSSTVIPVPHIGVRGFILDDGSFISGKIYMVGTAGIVLSEEDGTIRVDIIGDPYALDKACRDEGFDVPVFCGLKTVNGIRPDENGDFKLTIGGNLAADNILRVVQPSRNIVKIDQVGFNRINNG